MIGEMKQIYDDLVTPSAQVLENRAEYKRMWETNINTFEKALETRKLTCTVPKRQV